MAITLSAVATVTLQMHEQSQTTLQLGQNTLETGAFNTTKSYTITYPSAAVTKKYTASYVTATNINLTNGSLEDGFGNGLVYSNWMFVYVQNNDTQNTLTVGGGSNPLTGFTNSTVLQPGSALLQMLGATGVAVGGSSFMLNISGASMAYDICIIGN